MYFKTEWKRDSKVLTRWVDAVDMVEDWAKVTTFCSERGGEALVSLAESKYEVLLGFFPLLVVLCSVLIPNCCFVSCAELRDSKKNREVPLVPLLTDSVELPSGGVGSPSEKLRSGKRLRGAEMSEPKKSSGRSPGSSLRARKVREFRERVASYPGVRKVNFVEFLLKYKCSGRGVAILQKLREFWEHQSESNAEEKAGGLLEHAAVLLSDEEYPVGCMERLADKFDEDIALDNALDSALDILE
jgi:hypothetical protein